MMRTLTNCEPIGSIRNSRRQAAPGADSRGFTLLEILTAIFILAIVVSLALGAFDAIFSNADRVNVSSDLNEMGGAALDRMATDLKAVHVMLYPRYQPPQLLDDEPDIYRVEGKTTNVGGHTFAWLRFTSMAHLPLNHDADEGVAEIVYYVQETPDNDYIIRRADHLYPYPEFEERETDPELCEQVRDFTLTYFDADGKEYEEWDSESEDSEYGTPRAIKIKLALGDETAPDVFTTEIVLPVYRYKPIKR
jgi:general secretion pathway protein J